MSALPRMAACAALLLVAAHGARADYDLSPGALHQLPTQVEAAGEQPHQPAKAARKAVAEAATRSGPAGTLVQQTPSVSISCFRPALVEVIRNASRHFGSAAIITSGYRPGRRSYHGKCMAADVQIAGVAPLRLAAWFRAQEQVGGVGTYRHTRSVHVDVADREYSWHGGRRRVASLWRDY